MSCNNDTEDCARVLLVIVTQLRFVIIVNVAFVPPRTLTRTLRFTDYIHGKRAVADNSSLIVYRLQHGNEPFRDPYTKPDYRKRIDLNASRCLDVTYGTSSIASISLQFSLPQTNRRIFTLLQLHIFQKKKLFSPTITCCLILNF